MSKKGEWSFVLSSCLFKSVFIEESFVEEQSMVRVLYCMEEGYVSWVKICQSIESKWKTM